MPEGGCFEGFNLDQGLKFVVLVCVVCDWDESVPLVLEWYECVDLEKSQKE